MNIKNRSKLFVALAAAFLTLTAFTTAPAQSADSADTTLGALLDGGQFTSGDKLFTNWGFSPLGPLEAGSINVIAIQDVNGNYGFRLQSGFFAGSGDTVDYLVTYRVTATDPTKKIVDLHLLFNGFASGEGAITNITETAKDGDANVVGDQLGVFAIPSPGVSKLTDATEFGDNPQSFLDVSKDIFLYGGDADQSFTNISNIEQTFSQTGTGVPEPSSLALFGIGAGTLGFLAWRRKNRAAAE